MKRIADLDPGQMSAAQRRVYDAIASGPRKGVRGPLAVWLHRPELAEHAQALGSYCRYDTSLPPRLSELAILTLARVWSSEYEWYAHKPFALEAGLGADVIEAIRTNTEPPFAQADEAAVHAFLTELHRDRKVSDAVYAEAVERLGEAGVIDLVGLAGYYTLISMTINVFQVTQPAGVPNQLDESAA
ncbi:carboxymuconolactone decarboxylase family protein [Paraburkholderia sp. ZP32-5]|uniref:carboxymuconolactone decarboxylase family protein n=1 Tax=Paraburkholderia sp. ZP32-5 TaxID=2883245 RepID=UPI001F43BD98|nr:carboxymuconolactone decarboxylase family protein [Paraburkholderia sp. ZP32-5]